MLLAVIVELQSCVLARSCWWAIAAFASFLPAQKLRQCTPVFPEHICRGNVQDEVCNIDAVGQAVPQAVEPLVSFACWAVVQRMPLSQQKLEQTSQSRNF